MTVEHSWRGSSEADGLAWFEHRDFAGSEDRATSLWVTDSLYWKEWKDKLSGRIRGEPSWSIVREGDESSRLVEELRREVPPGHPLEGVDATPLARRAESDDVLFAVRDPAKPVALVHLTWVPAARNREGFPWTKFYGSFEEWNPDDEG